MKDVKSSLYYVNIVFRCSVYEIRNLKKKLYFTMSLQYASIIIYVVIINFCAYYCEGSTNQHCKESSKFSQNSFY